MAYHQWSEEYLTCSRNTNIWGKNERKSDLMMGKCAQHSMKLHQMLRSYFCFSRESKSSELESLGAHWGQQIASGLTDIQTGHKQHLPGTCLETGQTHPSVPKANLHLISLLCSTAAARGSLGEDVHAAHGEVWAKSLPEPKWWPSTKEDRLWLWFGLFKKSKKGMMFDTDFPEGLAQIPTGH